MLCYICYKCLSKGVNSFADCELSYTKIVSETFTLDVNHAWQVSWQSATNCGSS